MIAINELGFHTSIIKNTKYRIDRLFASLTLPGVLNETNLNGTKTRIARITRIMPLMNTGHWKVNKYKATKFQKLGNPVKYPSSVLASNWQNTKHQSYTIRSKHLYFTRICSILRKVQA